MEPVSNGGTFAPVYMLAYDNNTLLLPAITAIHGIPIHGVASSGKVTVQMQALRW